MKRILLLLIVAVTGVAAATARDFTYTYEGQTLTYTVLDEAAKTCQTKQGTNLNNSPGNLVSGNLVIPEKACDGSNEYSVIRIGSEAFSACSDLTNVTIPESVSEIGNYAFSLCTSLTSVSVPNSVNYMGEGVFYACSNLKTVILPNAITRIPVHTFNECNSLNSISIPESVTDIGGYAFRECSKLTSVTIPNSVTSIGVWAFSECISLSKVEFASIESLCKIDFGNSYSNPLCFANQLYINGQKVTNVNIPETITSLKYTFSGACYLNSVTIPNTVTSIGEYTFSGCSGLTSLTIPNSVTTIGYSAFSGCSGLTSVTIPNSVTSIGSDAFSGCSGLTSITIPNSVTSIGMYAFNRCSGLTSVVLPNSVTSIGGSAFRWCSGLKLLTVKCAEPPTLDDGIGDNDLYANAVLDIPAGSLKKYAVTEWGLFENIRVDGVMAKTYNDGVFKYRLIPDAVNPEAVLMKGDYSAMEEISIPERFTDESDPTNPVRYTISTIGAHAFSDCSNLKSVNFHSRSKITTIAPYAFCGCSGLTKVSVPESVTTIGSSAFYYCSGLTEVSIPESVTTIGSSAFYYCSGLTEVSIPESVTTIGGSAFILCSGLTKAEFASIESLCNIDFANNNANPLAYAHNLYINGEEITKLAIPESVSAIGQYAFYWCRGLTSVTIPNSVTSIGYSAFAWCNGLTSVTLGNSLSELDSSVFSGCDAIRSLTLADGGNYLELQGEASWLNNVSRLYLGRNMMTPEGTFVKFPALTDLEIGEGINEITPSAFAGYTDLSSLKLSNAVAKIGSNAFANCSLLTSVVIPNSVTSLGNRAFSGCSAITDLTIGNSVPSVSSTVFEGCTAIKTLTVADGPGTLSFQTGNSWLANVTKLYMGRNMAYTSGGDLKFQAVNDLTVGNEVTEIGASMFANCTGIKDLPLGNNLLTIGSSAFSGCSLTEVVVPPSVETIEASAFAGNTDLATIIMGHNVKSIGEKAYDGCAAQTIRITALTPPTAPNNTFSRYTGQLWVANAQAVEDYYNAYTCWDRFSAYAMIEPEEIKIEGAQTIDAAPGDTIRLTAKISPENVTLPQIFWRSTNPAVATVDNNGVVVVRGVEPELSTYAQGDDYSTEGGCRIIAESLYADAPIAMVAINSELADIEDIVIDRPQSQTIDYTEPYDVYNMQGVWLGRSVDAVAPGFYIVRQGTKAAKILK